MASLSSKLDLCLAKVKSQRASLVCSFTVSTVPTDLIHLWSVCLDPCPIFPPKLVVPVNNLSHGRVCVCVSCVEMGISNKNSSIITVTGNYSTTENHDLSLVMCMCIYS